MPINFNNQSFNVSREFELSFSSKKNSDNTITPQEFEQLQAEAKTNEEKNFLNEISTRNLIDAQIEPNTFTFSLPQRPANSGQSSNYQKALEKYDSLENRLTEQVNAYKSGNGSVSLQDIKNTLRELETELRTLERSTYTEVDRNNFLQKSHNCRELHAEVLGLSSNRAEESQEGLASINSDLADFNMNVQEYAKAGKMTQEEANSLVEPFNSINSRLESIIKNSTNPEEVASAQNLKRIFNTFVDRLPNIEQPRNSAPNTPPVKGSDVVRSRASAVSIGVGTNGRATGLAVAYADRNINLGVGASTNGVQAVLTTPNGPAFLRDVSLEARSGEKGKEVNISYRRTF